MTETIRLDPSVREVDLAPGGAVEIHAGANGLRIRGTLTDRVVVRTRGGERVDGEVTIETAPGLVRIRDGGQGELRIGPLRLRGHAAADLDVDVPRSARLTIRTVSGDVDGTGTAGDGRWSSASGDIRLRVEGGTVAADSLSGDIAIESDAAIAVGARTMSGDIIVRAARLDTVRAETVSGDVRLEAAFAHRAIHTVSSVSGDVELSTGSPVRIDAGTVSGDVRSALPHRAEGGRGRRTLVVGDGSVPITARTTSGDIRLRGGPSEAPDPALPASHGVAATLAAVAVPASMPPAPDGAAHPETGLEQAPANQPAPQAGSAPVARGGSTDHGGVGTDRRDAERLDVLRALERGDLDVDSASRRLELIDEAAGPRAFRGWC